MKVLIIPDWTIFNPFQSLFADSIRTRGADVQFGLPPGWFSILRWIKRNGKPHVLNLHWPDPYMLGTGILSGRKEIFIRSTAFILELIIIKLMGVKLVWTVHDLITHDAQFARFELRFYKIIARLSNYLVAHSRFAKEQIKQQYAISKDERIAVIPIGNYIGRYKNSVTKQQAREKLNLNPAHKIFLYLGLIRPYKGVDTLIDTFRQLNQPATTLMVVGLPIGEEFATEFKNKYGNIKNVRLIPRFVPDDHIELYMNSADVMVMPYKRIFTSSTVMLALSFAKPIIAPSFGGVAEVLRSTGNILFDPSDDKALLNALKKALIIDYDKIGNDNLKLARSKPYLWQTIAQEYMELFS